MTNLNGAVIITPLEVSRQWEIPEDELLLIKAQDKADLTEAYVNKVRELRQIEINIKRLDWEISRLLSRKTFAIIKEKHEIRRLNERN